MVLWDEGKGAGGEWLLTAPELLSEVMKMFWNLAVVTVAQLCKYARESLYCTLWKGEFYGMWVTSQFQKWYYKIFDDME